MHLGAGDIIRISWGALLVFWVVSARGMKRPARTLNLFSRFFSYTLPFIIAVMLIAPGYSVGSTFLEMRFLPDLAWIAFAGAVFVVVGAAVAIWARALLGRNWSTVPEVKDNHELIESGPYAWVRHPIYTGLLLMFLGSAIAIGQYRGLLGLAILAVSLWFKLRHEERWLAEHFGPAYRDYIARTWALIPGII